MTTPLGHPRSVDTITSVSISAVTSLITATVAAWFIDQTRDAAKAENVDLAERLRKMEATLAELHAVVLADGPELPARTTNGKPATPPGV